MRSEQPTPPARSSRTPFWSHWRLSRHPPGRPGSHQGQARCLRSRVPIGLSADLEHVVVESAVFVAPLADGLDAVEPLVALVSGFECWCDGIGDVDDGAVVGLNDLAYIEQHRVAVARHCPVTTGSNDAAGESLAFPASVADACDDAVAERSAGDLEDGSGRN